MRNIILSAIALSLAGTAAAHAQNVHIGPPTAPISMAVKVPAGSEMLYVSGITPTPTNPTAGEGVEREFGDTETQVRDILNKIEAILKAQGYSFGDVVMMRVVLVGDPSKGGKMDFPGMMKAYKERFGTAEQPNKPARITTQIAALGATKMLAEIEVQAAKAPK